MLINWSCRCESCNHSGSRAREHTRSYKHLMSIKIRCGWNADANAKVVRNPRPVRESSCPTWSFLPVAWFLSDWYFHFSDSGPEVLRSSSPWSPPFILSLGCDVSGSAEPALVLCALGTEHLPRCSHMDAILRFVRYRLLAS